MRLRHFFLYQKRALGVLASVLFIGGIGHFFVLEPTRVNGTSMAPALENNERILMEKLSLLVRAPKRGQLVGAFDARNELLLVKRVIALPGEQVVIRRDGLYIVDRYGIEAKLDEPYVDQALKTLPKYGQEAVYPLLQDHQYFLMGDNRESSVDSRSFGAVHRSNIVGTILRIPLIGRIGTTSDPYSALTSAPID
ncbi:MAG: signal peptidase I [bacterium]|nr:signal peptidase I [bacterium]MDA1024352.1 signal peptidase I [bacterium]